MDKIFWLTKLFEYVLTKYKTKYKTKYNTKSNTK